MLTENVFGSDFGPILTLRSIFSEIVEVLAHAVAHRLVKPFPSLLQGDSASQECKNKPLKSDFDNVLPNVPPF